MTTTSNSIYMRVKGQRAVENHAQVPYARDLFKFIIVNVVLIFDKSLSSRKGHHIALVDIQRHAILQTPLINYRQTSLQDIGILLRSYDSENFEAISIK